MNPPSFPPADDTARAATLSWICETPLVYGPWQIFKRLYKEAEAAYTNGTRETEIMAALLARLDAQPLVKGGANANAAVPGNFGALCAREGFAYVWARGRELQTYDLSAPAQPKLVATWAPALTDPMPVEIVAGEGKLWLFSGSRLWLLSLEDPAAPTLLDDLNTRGFQRAIVGDNLVVLLNGQISISQIREGALREIGTCEFPNAYYNLVGGSNFAAGLTYDYTSRRGRYFMQFADLSDPTKPRLAAKLAMDYSTQLAQCGDYWLSLVNRELRVYDLSDLDKPQQIGALKIEDGQSLVCENNRAAILCSQWTQNGYETRVRLVDLSDPKVPAALGIYDLKEAKISRVNALALAGDALYLSAPDGLHILDITDPARPQAIGKSPSPDTFAYLKRRGRRLLRTLSESDAAAFTTLASAFFAEIKTRPNLDWDDHWIAADLVAAQHPNWMQASHGRGAYLVKRDAKALVIKRRVERASAAWDAHPEALEELARESETAPVVHLARQVCGVAASLSPAQIESYVSSRWPNLRALGARAALAADARALSPRGVAGALWVCNARKRRELLDSVGASPAVASELASFLGASLPIERDKFGRRTRAQVLTRRAREIALLLAARFDLSDPAFLADGALPILRVLLGAGEAPLRSLGAQFCRRLSADEVLPLVSFGVNNAAVLEALMESAARADFGKEQIDKAIRASERAERAAAWQLVEASQTSGATLGAVWLSLLRGLTQNYNWGSGSSTITWRISDALQSALSYADARACLVRGALDPSEVRPRWSQEFVGSEPGAYYQNAGVPGEVFAAYALFLPPATLVKTIAGLTDAKWGEWKAQFVAAITPHAGVAAGFWSAVQEFLSGKDPNIEQLRARTFNDPAVAATFAGAAGQLSPALLLSLIGSVPASVWETWRPQLLQVLQTDGARREAFWEAARALSFEAGLLRARLIDDAEFAATFGLLESDVLQFDDPALETLLLQWVGARELEGETAIEAAIHPLPNVRALGLRALVERGLNVPIALRLLESDLRDAMDAAKDWFNSRTENIANLALALCDSPRLRVREWGREFVGARLDALLRDGLLEKLQENPNAEMQGFVAQLLLNRENAEADNAGPLEFDRAVLRGRNRARRAKNLVQTRRAQGAALPDDATLLELARGRTPRDAQWALEQLARRALEGEVAGIEVGGVGAI